MSTPLKNVLVTGGCGFIGSNFINEAFRAWPETRLINYDNLGPAANINNISEHIRNSERYVLVTGNLNHQALLKRTIEKYDIDGVIHFAAESNVDYSFENKLSTVDNNVNGTINLLEAMRTARGAKIHRFLNVSTDEVYGDSEGETFAKTEEMTLSPTSPYSATKAGAEMLVMAYIISYRIPGVRVRMCNVYGENQHVSKVVPKFVEVARRREPFPIHGDGHQQRTWLHAIDACRAIRRVFVDGKVGEVYNVATENEVSIIDLARLINKYVAEILGQPEAKFETFFPEDRPYNDKRYHIGFTKFEAEFGEKIKSIGFEEGMRATVEAYLLRPKKINIFGKVLVFGGNGWIGGQFKSLLNDNGIETIDAQSRPGTDADQKIEDEIRDVAPSHVVSLLGRTHGPGVPNIDFLEGGPDKVTQNVRDNLYAPWLLAQFCNKVGIHMTYIGSGCLFNYDERHPIGSRGYTESDVPNYFGSSYSVVKGFTDRMMHSINEFVLNVRMRLPVSYDKHPRNLISKITSYPEIADLPNSVTVLPELLPILVNLMEKRFTGTINLVNSGTALHSEVLECFKAKINPSLRYSLMDLSTPAAKKLCAKRSNCKLDTTLLEQIAPNVPNAKGALEKAVSEIAKKQPPIKCTNEKAAKHYVTREDVIQNGVPLAYAEMLHRA